MIMRPNSCWLSDCYSGEIVWEEVDLSSDEDEGGYFDSDGEWVSDEEGDWSDNEDRGRYSSGEWGLDEKTIQDS